ncbi:hypothetical protein MHPYR_180074 [uncultured Mycobacterium sp.]|uniref:Uncharacterized protein n=1 Tax=uncultured Mycobacterium sp. TaxID=171292 RepID=A0A1Y5P528_9MYCO|nr:hypothetical protein MHPYR_180074 [uncultured Mycobacterium sp.]
MANRRFCDKVDLLPTARRSLAEMDPEMDARLRVAWK